MVLVRSGNKKTGQSILELGIFGAILLFVLGWFIQQGMRANYQQYLEMWTFRKALAEAVEGWDEYINSNVTVITMKDTIEPADIFGMGSPQYLSASAQGVWSVGQLYNIDGQVDVPRMDILINPEALHPIPDEETGSQVISSTSSYTLAKYMTYNCASANNPGCSYGGVDYDNCVRFKSNDYPIADDDYNIIPGSDKYNIAGDLINPDQDPGGGDDIYWYWKIVPCEWVITPDDSDYYQPDPDDEDEEVISKGSMADVDGDARDEMIVDIIEASGDDPVHPEDTTDWCVVGYWTFDADGLPDRYHCQKYVADKFKVFDYQEGDIDSTLDSADFADGRKRQGPIPFYETEFIMDNILHKEEDQGTMTYTSTINVEDKISTKVRINHPFVDPETGEMTDEESLQAERHREKEDSWTADLLEE